jgi:hypothetical protein
VLSLPYTDALKASIEASPYLAFQHLHNTTGPEHLLHAVLQVEGARAPRILSRASGHDALAHWHEIWPEGVRKPKGSPPMTPLARGVIDYLIAGARLRGRCVVSTADLLRVLVRTRSPELDDYFSAIEVDATRLAEEETRMQTLELLCLRASIEGVGRDAHSSDVPAMRRTITSTDGSIAAALESAWLGRTKSKLTTGALLEGVQASDPPDRYPIQELLESLDDQLEEPGEHDLTVNEMPIVLSDAAVIAVAATLYLRDVYRITFARGDLVVAGLLLTGSGAVREGFTRLILGGLTTTRSHVELAVGTRLHNLSVVLGALNRQLRAKLHPGVFVASVLVDVAAETWEVTDSDPLTALDHLFFALTRAPEDPTDALRCYVDDLQAGLGDSDQHGVTFRQMALQCLWLAAIVLGRSDSDALPTTYRRLREVAISDAWGSRVSDLAGWGAKIALAPTPPTASFEHGDVASLLRCDSTDEVLHLVRERALWPSSDLRDAVDAAITDKVAPVSEFAANGNVEDVLAEAWGHGLERTSATARSSRVAARLAGQRPLEMFNEVFTPSVFGDFMKDRMAADGIEQADALLSDLNEAPTPLDVSAFEDAFLRLSVNASQALGSEYEERYLPRFVMAKVLVAEKAGDPAVANEAAEQALHAFKLSSLTSFEIPGRIAADANLLRLWSNAASALADRPGHTAEADLLAVRLAVFAACDPAVLTEVLGKLRAVRLDRSRRWVDMAVEVVDTAAGITPRPSGPTLGLRAEAVARVGAARVSELMDAVNVAFDRFRATPTHDRMLEVDAATQQLIDLDVTTRDGTALLLVQLCAALNFAAQRGIGDPTASRRIASTGLRVVETTPEPGVHWAEFVDQWLRVLEHVSRAQLIEGLEAVLAVEARGFRDARSHPERLARAARLRATTERMAIELAQDGSFESAAAAVELTADLTRRDRREGWAPPPLAQSITEIDDGPHLAIGQQTGDPYLFAFVRRPDTREPQSDWLTTRRAEVRRAGWPIGVRCLIVIPGIKRGAVLALENGRWQGWTAPALNRDALGEFLPLLGVGAAPESKAPDRARVISRLQEMIPRHAAAWAVSSRRLVVVPRSWTEIVPIHAMLTEASPQPSDQSVVVSHATSIGAYVESMTHSVRAEGRPSAALIVTNPRPSELRALAHATWEHGTLSATVDAVNMLAENEAARKSTLDGLAASPDLFHFAGHATAGELALAYDARVSVSDILRLTFTPPRLAVLSGCHTAIPAAQSTEHEALSMASAFQDTRCPAVIGNLWEVDDLATALVIDAFYRELTHGGWRNLPSALLRATDWLRTATWRDVADRLEEIRVANPAVPSSVISHVPRRKHPYDDPDYWAPFVFYGA